MIAFMAMQISRIPIKGKCLSVFIGAIIDSLFSIVIIIFLKRYYVYILWSILFGIPILAFSITKNWYKHMMKKVLINMYIAAIILAGSMMMFENIVNVKLNSICIYIVGVIMSEIVVCIITVFRKRGTYIYQAVITDKDKQVQVNALYDSGNRLRYKEENKGIHIVTSAVLRELGTKQKYTDIQYRALGTTYGQISVYKVEKLEVMSDKKIYEEENVFLGMAEDELLEGKEYQIILNGDIL